MGALDRAVNHFKTRLGDPKTIEVPEWGEDGKPLTIYVHPITMAEKDEIFKVSQTGSYRGVVMALVVRARDENGKRLFKTIELGELMKKADPEVISDIVLKMKSVFDEPLKDDIDSELEEVKKP